MMEKHLRAAMQTTPTVPMGDTFTNTVVLSPDLAAKLRLDPPAYTLQVRLGLINYEPATPVPLLAGGWTVRDGLGEHIAHVEKSGEELLVTFIRHNPALWVDMAGGWPVPRAQIAQYFLVNRANDFTDRGTAQIEKSTRIASVEIAWQTMAYHASKNAGGPRPTLEAINALNDAELMRVSFVEQARFTHELKVDRLVVEPAKP
jgi:hypothetical protein